MNTRAALASFVGLALLAGPAISDDVGLLAPLFSLEGNVEPVEGAGSVVARQPIATGSIPFDALAEFAAGRSAGVLDLSVPLFDEEVGVRLDSVAHTGDDDFILSGHPITQPGGLVVLLVSEGRLAGRLNSGDQNYMIRKIGAAHFLLKLDPGRLPPHAPPTLPKPSPSQGVQDDAPPHAHTLTTCDPTTSKQISVQVLYTGAARDGAAADAQDSSMSGGAEIRADALLALASANAALTNSLASPRFKAAADPVEVAYSETGDGYRALQHLYKPGHPLYLAATGQRNGANLVALVIEHWEQACGAAPVMIDWNTHPDQTAFSVVRRHCLREGLYSLAHELAHSMGSAHDWEHAGVPGLFEFSYGYTAYQDKLSTIMAYPCPGCTREKNFSNPDVVFQGSGTPYLPSGVQCSSADPECRPSDNAQSLNRAACQVVNWH
jgi:hypothetical protein